MVRNHLELNRDQKITLQHLKAFLRKIKSSPSGYFDFNAIRKKKESVLQWYSVRSYLKAHLWRLVSEFRMTGVPRPKGKREKKIKATPVKLNYETNQYIMRLLFEGFEEAQPQIIAALLEKHKTEDSKEAIEDEMRANILFRLFYNIFYFFLFTNQRTHVQILLALFRVSHLGALCQAILSTRVT